MQADALAHNPSRKRALVLAGGGMRVAYQAGVVYALEAAGLSFELLDGASGGTMNLAMRLSGLSAAEACERWRKLNVQHFAALLSLPEYFTAGGLPGFGGDAGVKRVFGELGIDVEKIRAFSGAQGTFNVCNYTDKINVAVPHQQITPELLVAGVSLPMFMPAVEHAGKTWVDAVWIKDANLTEMVKRGAEEIWLVWCIGNTSVYNPGTLEQYVHMIEISANASLFKEFEWISELNERLASGQSSPYGQRGPITVHVVKPNWALPLDPAYFAGHIDSHTLLAMGYADARRYLAAIKPSGIALDPHATQMFAQRRGIAFREAFSGNLLPGVARAAGATGGGATRLRCAVEIPELERFRKNSAEPAALYGSIDIAGLGERLWLWDGKFAIQTQPTGRVISFSARFDAQGKHFHLRAHKSLNGNAAQILTSLCQIQCEVVQLDAAGGAELKWLEGSLAMDTGALPLLSSLRATGTQGLVAAAEVLAEFAAFYGGEVLAALLKPKKKPWWKFW